VGRQEEHTSVTGTLEYDGRTLGGGPEVGERTNTAAPLLLAGKPLRSDPPAPQRSPVAAEWSLPVATPSAA
jgi:hypothetical protein